MTLSKKRIFVFDAEPGMRLFADVIGNDGFLIAGKDTVLDLDTIARISSCHILEIDVYDIAVTPPAVEESTYFEKIRESKEFIEFHKDYDDSVSNLKNQLNDIVTRNTEIDEDRLMKDCLDIMKKTPNRLQMFDMLHSLRQFDDLTYAHSVNVALISSIIGQWMNYSEEDIKTLLLAGLLHDIGKVNIPIEVLNKPGRLTPEEFDIIKKHTSIGYDFIKDKQIDGRVKEACLLHHEKCDGSGYPFNLTSDKIPAFAKIVAIADIYDAMTADRVYRSAVCPFKVIAMMEKDCFRTLDPIYTLTFLKNIVSSYIHTTVKLSNDAIGEVILINDRDLSRPVVRCGNDFIDLSKENNLSIVAIL